MTPATNDLSTLTAAIDAAVTTDDRPAVCERVKHALASFTNGGGLLDAQLLEPVADGYGRRLLHRDPGGRYTIVLMIWSPGQGTPIHDHAGLWCVECVFRGRIRVSSYRVEAEHDDGRMQFAPETEVQASIGEAGALIPPLDYHVIENPFDETAATLHVYGGEMEKCDVFVPADEGAYRRETKALHYTA